MHDRSSEDRLVVGGPCPGDPIDGGPYHRRRVGGCGCQRVLGACRGSDGHQPRASDGHVAHYRAAEHVSVVRYAKPFLRRRLVRRRIGRRWARRGRYAGGIVAVVAISHDNDAHHDEDHRCDGGNQSPSLHGRGGLVGLSEIVDRQAVRSSLIDGDRLQVAPQFGWGYRRTPIVHLVAVLPQQTLDISHQQ